MNKMAQNRFSCERIFRKEKEKMLRIKLDIVNKKQYEAGNNYQEIIIHIPRPESDLVRGFEYLDLDYNNLNIKDTHVTRCDFISESDPAFSEAMSYVIHNLTEKSMSGGYTMPYQDIVKFYEIVCELSDRDRNKLLAIMESQTDYISNIKDAIKYAQHLECFEFVEGVSSREGYAQYLIDERDVCIEDIMSYIDLEQMGEDYIEGNDGFITRYGCLLIMDSIRDIENENENDEKFEVE